MKDDMNLDFLKRLAKGIVQHFGNDCEVVIHDLKADKFTKYNYRHRKWSCHQ